MCILKSAHYALRNYETGGYSGPVFGPAFDLAAQANDNRLDQWLSEVMMAGQPELEAVMTEFARAHYPGVMPLWMQYGVPVSPPHMSAQNGQDFANIVFPAPPHLSGQVLGSLNGQPTASQNFWKAVAANPTIMGSPSLSGNPNWQMPLSGIMADYGDMNDLAGFYDSYWQGARDWLDLNLPLQQRLEEFYDDPGAGLQAIFARRIGEQAFTNLIAGMSGMTMSYYQTVIAGSASGVVIYTGYADTLALAEHHIYGSSRLGMQTYAKERATMNVWQQYRGLINDSLSRRTVWYSFAYGDLIDSASKTPWGYGDGSWGLKLSRTVGLKYYELSDHLGNVLATVLDRKTGHRVGSASNYSYWKADVASAQDYFPFGMEMPGRTHLPAMGLASKFGFNGQQKDDEVAGKGNTVEFKFRGYDPRLGRFKGVDPLAHSYPWNSPYAFAENDVIRAIDIEGLEKYLVINYYSSKGYLEKTAIKTVTDAVTGALANFNFALHKDKTALIMNVRGGIETIDGSRSELTRREMDIFQKGTLVNRQNYPTGADWNRPGNQELSGFTSGNVTSETRELKYDFRIRIGKSAFGRTDAAAIKWQSNVIKNAILDPVSSEQRLVFNQYRAGDLQIGSIDVTFSSKEIERMWKSIVNTAIAGAGTGASINNLPASPNEGVNVDINLTPTNP